MPFSKDLLTGASGNQGAGAFYEYQIEQSARFDRASSSYLYYSVPSGAATDAAWTVSMWIKRGQLGIGDATLLGNSGGWMRVKFTSADILSERMIEISKFLKDKKSNILLQVHDEIICEIHDSELETIPFDIRSLLEINTLNIPLSVDMEICNPSWATKKDFKLPTLEDYIDWDDATIMDSEGIEWK